MNKSILTALILGFVASQTQAAVIIDNTSVGLYNNSLGDLAAIDGPGGFLPAANISEGDPSISLAADPAFAFTAAFGTDWLAGDYTGGTWSAGPTAIPSTWAVNTETAIVYDFNLSNASDLSISLGVDNGIVAWLDGNFIFGQTAPGGASPNEYSIDLTGILAGNHLLQILRADHGGGTGYAISVDAADTSSPPAASVPEPSSMALLALGLVGLGFSRRKRA